MATYQEVFNIIKAALSGRQSGTQVYVARHEAALIAVLDYVESLKTTNSDYSTRGAHGDALAGVPCELIWNRTFKNTAYDFSVNGFTDEGYPVEITLLTKIGSKIIVSTLVDATLTATAVAY